MADTKGSSSHPTRGLVNHLDRNRNLQQDRFVTSPSAPSIPFRSQAQNRTTASEASFNNFNTATAQLGALSLQTAHQHPQTFRQPFRPEVGRNWANEFNQRATQDPRIMSSSMRANEDARAAAASRVGGPQNDGSSQGPVFQDQVTFNHSAGFQHGSTTTQVPVGYQYPVQQHMVQPMIQSMVQPMMQEPRRELYINYPEHILADTPVEAMEAAFAGYDDDFQSEMNGWMGTHGPEDHTRQMEALLARDALRGNVLGQTELGPSINPDVPGSNITTYEAEREQSRWGNTVEEREESRGETATQDGRVAEDAELRKHAVQILATLGAEGSADTRKKLSTSSFVGLMNAIATGQAVVHEENFINPATGQVIEDWGALSGAANKAVDAEDDAEGTVQGKGKGKMKNLEEQAMELNGDAPSSASA